jgi:uncharacterized protein (TIGR02217 family)
MSAFLEERLPVNIRIGASYADDYNVEVTRTAGGKEYRRLVHGIPLRRFRVSFARAKATLFTEIQALYHRTYGRFAGFRVKAFDDYTTNGMTSAPTAVDQVLLRVSAGVYQLRKEYGVGAAGVSGIGRPYRTLFKPVAGTTRVAADGIELMSGVAVDTTTGLVTLTPDPGEGAVVTGGCEFDIPCRFDSALDVTPVSTTWAETADIDIVELIDL